MRISGDALVFLFCGSRSCDKESVSLDPTADGLDICDKINKENLNWQIPSSFLSG